MRNALPATVFGPQHADFVEVKAVADAILLAVGGEARLAKSLGDILRNAIDTVIDTPHTSRCDYEELEKTEKTYLGTRVEIHLRALTRFPKGKLDLVIAGRDVDIKFTIASNWMIPTEAIDNICILTAADEQRALCYMGLLKAHRAYLTGGANRDGKKSVSTFGFTNICWLVSEQPYVANFWRSVPTDKRRAIFLPRSGTGRIVKLFEEIRRTPINRSVIESVAQQKDYMKRLRANGGARDELDKKKIRLLSGKFDADEIKALGIGFCDKDSFVAI